MQHTNIINLNVHVVPHEVEPSPSIESCSDELVTEIQRLIQRLRGTSQVSSCKFD